MGGCESSPDDVYDPHRRGGRWQSSRTGPWQNQSQRMPIGGNYRGDPMMYGGPDRMMGGGMPPPSYGRYSGGDYYGGGQDSFYSGSRPGNGFGGGGFR